MEDIYVYVCTYIMAGVVCICEGMDSDYVIEFS